MLQTTALGKRLAARHERSNIRLGWWRRPPVICQYRTLCTGVAVRAPRRRLQRIVCGEWIQYTSPRLVGTGDKSSYHLPETAFAVRETANLLHRRYVYPQRKDVYPHRKDVYPQQKDVYPRRNDVCPRRKPQSLTVGAMPPSPRSRFISAQGRIGRPAERSPPRRVGLADFLNVAGDFSPTPLERCNHFTFPTPPQPRVCTTTPAATTGPARAHRLRKAS